MELLPIDALGEMYLNNKPIPDDVKSKIANEDGFQNATQLADYFRKSYELPFVGELLRWTRKKEDA